PGNTNTIYAGVGGQHNADGVYKSTDGGASWTGIWTGQAHGVHTLVISPSDPSTIYVTSNSGLFDKTTDAGANWAPLATNQTVAVFSSLIVDFSNPAIMYGASYALGFVKSTDEGATWTPSNSGLPGLNISTLA